VVGYRVVVVSSIDPGHRLVEGIDSSKSYCDNLHRDTGFIQSCCPTTEHHTRQLKGCRAYSWFIRMEPGYESSYGTLEPRYVFCTTKQEKIHWLKVDADSILKREEYLRALARAILESEFHS
jgi:hypothetical protein